MPTRRRVRQLIASATAVWLVLLSPATALANGVDATGNPTGATTCTGAGCGQGAGQGAGQGGVSAEDLGADEEGNLPDGVVDTRQGAGQGTSQGTAGGGVDLNAENTNTGAGSDNEIDVDASSSTDIDIDNTADTTTNADLTGNTGGNTSSSNTGDTVIDTGDAGIGVTQVVNDNTAVVGGTAGLTIDGHAGDHDGDLVLGFGVGTADLGSGDGTSIRAVNETTGSESDNSIDIETETEELIEVQNDGQIDNILDLAAITGQNEADKNTGDAAISTGDADVAATLVNLLNTTVINGDLWVTVADIFGDLNGDIVIDDLAAFLSTEAAAALAIDAVNEGTGDSSGNSIDIDIEDEEEFNVDNEADITTVVDAEAITGQNEASSNTGGATVDTGDAHVSASNVSVANTTVEGGNWALVVVNALNGWLGFLVGDNGEVQALSQDETIREIEAHNSDTGSDSDNEIDIDLSTDRTTDVENDAVINNEIAASAITGQNDAHKNTGSADIDTGDANVQATAVNIANTTVKDGSLFIAVVNIFGEWTGDLLYDGTSLAATAGGSDIDISAENNNTGAESENDIDIDVDRSHDTTIDNDADIETILNAEVDTGNNTTNRNTGGADIETGDGLLALHSRNVANLVGLADEGGLHVEMVGSNDTTGFDSENTINADINDSRVVTVTNDANVSTVLGSAADPGMVNTGNNTANQNTLGGRIATGDAGADIAIDNLVNQVITALAGGAVGAGTPDYITIDAVFLNRLTGNLSDNENELDVDAEKLLSVLNDALIENLIDLLLNTGGNTANGNTGGGLVGAASVGGPTSIATGAACASGSVHTNANAVIAGVMTSVLADNTADVRNQFNIQATTGNNRLERNTVGGAAAPAGSCDKIAMVPEIEEPTPAPDDEDEVVQSDDGEGGGAGSGAGGGDEEVSGSAVASAQDSPAKPSGPVGQVLTRFPVAGMESLAKLTGGKRSLLPLLLAAAMAAVAGAWYCDRRAADRTLRLPTLYAQR